MRRIRGQKALNIIQNNARSERSNDASCLPKKFNGDVFRNFAFDDTQSSIVVTQGFRANGKAILNAKIDKEAYRQLCKINSSRDDATTKQEKYAELLISRLLATLPKPRAIADDDWKKKITTFCVNFSKNYNQGSRDIAGFNLLSNFDMKIFLFLNDQKMQLMADTDETYGEFVVNEQTNEIEFLQTVSFAAAPLENVSDLTDVRKIKLGKLQTRFAVDNRGLVLCENDPKQLDVQATSILADYLDCNDPALLPQKQFNLLKKAILDHHLKHSHMISPEEKGKNIKLLVDFVASANQPPQNANLILDLSGADLSGADLSGAILTGITISDDTNLSKTRFTDVTMTENTQFTYIYNVKDENNKTLFLASLTINPKEFYEEFLAQYREICKHETKLSSSVIEQNEKSRQSGGQFFGETFFLMLQHVRNDPNSRAAKAFKQTFYKLYKTQEYKKLAALQSQALQAEHPAQRAAVTPITAVEASEIPVATHAHSRSGDVSDEFIFAGRSGEPVAAAAASAAPVKSPTTQGPTNSSQESDTRTSGATAATSAPVTLTAAQSHSQQSHDDAVQQKARLEMLNRCEQLTESLHLPTDVAVRIEKKNIEQAYRATQQSAQHAYLQDDAGMIPFSKDQLDKLRQPLVNLQYDPQANTRRASMFDRDQTGVPIFTFPNTLSGDAKKTYTQQLITAGVDCIGASCASGPDNSFTPKIQEQLSHKNMFLRSDPCKVEFANDGTVIAESTFVFQPDIMKKFSIILPCRSKFQFSLAGSAKLPGSFDYSVSSAACENSVLLGLMTGINVPRENQYLQVLYNWIKDSEYVEEYNATTNNNETRPITPAEKVEYLAEYAQKFSLPLDLSGLDLSGVDLTKIPDIENTIFNSTQKFTLKISDAVLEIEPKKLLAAYGAASRRLFEAGVYRSSRNFSATNPGVRFLQIMQYAQEKPNSAEASALKQAYYDAYKAHVQASLSANQALTDAKNPNADQKRALVEGLLALADHLDVKRDLSDLDLSGANLRGVDLSYANFSGSKLENTNFSKSNVVGAQFGDNKKPCRVNNGTNFDEIIIGVSQKEKTEFRLKTSKAGDFPTALNINIQYSDKISCKILTAELIAKLVSYYGDLRGATLFGFIAYAQNHPDGKEAKAWNQVQFDILKDHFKNKNLDRADVELLLQTADRCKVKRDLSGLNLTGCDLKALDLRRTNLNGATLNGAQINRNTDLRDATFSKVKFDDNSQFEFQHYFRDGVAYNPITTTPNVFMSKLFAEKRDQQKSAYLEKLEKMPVDSGEKFLLALQHSQTVVTGFITDHRSSATQAKMEDVFGEIAFAETPKQRKVGVITLEKVVQGVSYKDCDLREARFEDMEIIAHVNAQFENCMLNRTQVFQILATGHGAKLKKTDLRNLDLRKLNFQNVVLSGADLRGADLRGADLRGADLRGADLRDAKFDNNTRFDADTFAGISKSLSDSQVKALLTSAAAVTPQSTTQPVMLTPKTILESVIQEIQKTRADKSISDAQKLLQMTLLLFNFLGAAANNVKITKNGKPTNDTISQSADDFLPCLEAIFRSLGKKDQSLIKETMRTILNNREILEGIFGHGLMGYQLTNCELLNDIILRNDSVSPTVNANLDAPILWHHHKAISDAAKIATLLNNLTCLILSDSLDPYVRFRCEHSREILLENANPLEEFEKFNQEFDEFLTIHHSDIVANAEQVERAFAAYLKTIKPYSTDPQKKERENLMGELDAWIKQLPRSSNNDTQITEKEPASAESSRQQFSRVSLDAGEFSETRSSARSSRIFSSELVFALALKQALQSSQSIPALPNNATDAMRELHRKVSGILSLQPAQAAQLPRSPTRSSASLFAAPSAPAAASAAANAQQPKGGSPTPGGGAREE